MKRRAEDTPSLRWFAIGAMIGARDRDRRLCSGNDAQGGQHVINYRREQSAHTAFFHRHRKRRPPSVRRDRRGGLRRSSGGAESREGNPQAVLYWASFRLSGSATADFGDRRRGRPCRRPERRPRHAQRRIHWPQSHWKKDRRDGLSALPNPKRTSRGALGSRGLRDAHAAASGLIAVAIGTRVVA